MRSTIAVASLALILLVNIAPSSQQEVLPAPVSPPAGAAVPSLADFTNSLNKFINTVGPQVESAKSLSNLLSSATGQAAAAVPAAVAAPAEQAAGSGGPSFSQVSAFASQVSNALSGAAPKPEPPSTGSQIVGSLTEMVRSAQQSTATRATQAAESIQTGSQSAKDNVGSAASQAQGGLQTAFSEIASGLKKIANNSPSLIPDVKNLYNTVAAKISSTMSPLSAQSSPAGALPANPISALAAPAGPAAPAAGPVENKPVS